MGDMDEEYRRADDMLDPMSPAHEAIYAKMESCRNDVIDELRKTVEEHERSRHHIDMRNGIRGLTPDELVESVIDMRMAVPYLLDAVVGPAKRDQITGRTLVDANGNVSRDESKGLLHHLQNGGVPATIVVPWGRILVIIATNLAAIITAVALLTGHKL